MHIYDQLITMADNFVLFTQGFVPFVFKNNFAIYKKI